MWNINNLDLSPYEGFIYLITIKETGEKYIGKKSFWSRRTLKPLKGKKRKRKVVKESNWKTYKSSHKDIKNLPEEALDKKVLKLCKDKISLSYYENYYLYKHEAILKEDYLNSNISGRFFRNKIHR